MKNYLQATGGEDEQAETSCGEMHHQDWKSSGRDILKNYLRYDRPCYTDTNLNFLICWFAGFCPAEFQP
jgi:hypothetical protein